MNFTQSTRYAAVEIIGAPDLYPEYSDGVNGFDLSVS